MKIERFEDIDPSDKEAEICEGLRAYEEIKATNREPNNQSSYKKVK